jgi:hypothetical protein
MTDKKKTTDLTDNGQNFVMHVHNWYDNLKSLMRDEMVDAIEKYKLSEEEAIDIVDNNLITEPH